MKISVLAAGILVIIVAGCIFSLYFTEKTTTDILDTLDMCEQAVDNNDWDLALDHIYLTNALWNKNRKTLAAFLRHDELDRVTEALCRTTAVVMEKDKSDYMVESSVLAEFIEHISTLDHTTMENIF